MADLKNKKPKPKRKTIKPRIPSDAPVTEDKKPNQKEAEKNAD